MGIFFWFERTENIVSEMVRTVQTFKICLNKVMETQLANTAHIRIKCSINLNFGILQEEYPHIWPMLELVLINFSALMFSLLHLSIWQVFMCAHCESSVGYCFNRNSQWFCLAWVVTNWMLGQLCYFDKSYSWKIRELSVVVTGGKHVTSWLQSSAASGVLPGPLWCHTSLPAPLLPPR